MNRRKFIRKSVWGTIGIGAVSGLYTWQVEPFWLEFVKKKIHIKHLPESLKGKKLMQISDIHVGNRFDFGYIIDAFKQAQKLQPDIVVYTGDYVSYENEQQFGQLEKVLKHAVRGSLGTVGIFGNHDYGKNWAEQDVADRIGNQLETAGIQMLRNTSVDIQGLNIIGFDDYWGLNFSPANALKTYKENKANIVLCHNPDVCDLNVWKGYKGWIFSGHTHGGQCKPPFLPPPVLPVRNKNYSAGEIDLGDGRMLYINRALGHSWQVRFNVRPEITVFELA
ncbi:metallophosphoesterase (plasmid) [Fulvitalea axinellae]|uniref:Metallophosphoesterase n=1 Tax=Fulvitalea axinellae TaxID=1182444 RepID=A0AAU9CTR6_9BACT|nr:metallophosphoesterase [Fulvitalea axinellae]